MLILQPSGLSILDIICLFRLWQAGIVTPLSNSSLYSYDINVPQFSDEYITSTSYTVQLCNCCLLTGQELYQEYIFFLAFCFPWCSPFLPFFNAFLYFNFNSLSLQHHLDIRAKAQITPTLPRNLSETHILSLWPRLPALSVRWHSWHLGCFPLLLF